MNRFILDTLRGMFVAVILVVSLACAPRAFARDIKVLAVGNSHACCGTEYLYEVLKQVGYKNVTVASCHKVGRGLDYNYESAVNGTPNHVFRYTTNGKWETVSETFSVRDALIFEDWDYVILQTKLVDQAVPKKYKTADGENRASLMADLVREIVPNEKVKVGWNMLWAYHNGFTKKDFEMYFKSDSEALYEATLKSVRKYVYKTGKYDFIAYCGPLVEILQDTYIGETILSGYYGNSGQYSKSMGIHMGGTIGAYAEAMCFAKAMGADITKVKKMKPKAIHFKYTKPTALDLRTIQTGIEAAWKDPWQTKYGGVDDTSPLKVE